VHDVVPAAAVGATPGEPGVRHGKHQGFVQVHESLGGGGVVGEVATRDGLAILLDLFHPPGKIRRLPLERCVVPKEQYPQPWKCRITCGAAPYGMWSGMATTAMCNGLSGEGLQRELHAHEEGRHAGHRQLLDRTGISTLELGGLPERAAVAVPALRIAQRASRRT
jgi:hypothetical protein